MNISIHAGLFGNDLTFEEDKEEGEKSKAFRVEIRLIDKDLLKLIEALKKTYPAEF